MIEDAEVKRETFRISRNEVMAALILAAGYDVMELRKIREMCGDDGERLPPAFMAFCSELYSRGFSHGEHTARCDAFERLQSAGQTAAAAMMERVHRV
jgi:hypothetical protein